MAKGSTTRRGKGIQARVDGPVNPRTGKRRQLSKQLPNQRTADVWIAEQIHLREAGTHMEPSTITVGDYLAEWLLMVEARGTKQATLDQYASLIRCHLLPTMGATKLQKLGPLHVTRMIADLRARSLSDSTVNHAYRIIRQSLGDATALGMVRENVAARVPAPRAGRREMQCWSHPQARAFLTATEGTYLSPLWYLALATGMRRGELLGLRWKDVDLDGSALTIRQSSTFTSKGRELDGPKTPGSVRTLALQAPVITRLRAHRLAQLQDRLAKVEVWVDRDLVFAGEMGEGVWEATVRRGLLAGVEVAGVPRIRVHDLRHTFATLALLDGNPVHLVARRLGHANPAQTLRTYAHCLPSSDRELSDRMGAILFG